MPRAQAVRLPSRLLGDGEAGRLVRPRMRAFLGRRAAALGVACRQHRDCADDMSSRTSRPCLPHATILPPVTGGAVLLGARSTDANAIEPHVVGLVLRVTNTAPDTADGDVVY